MKYFLHDTNSFQDDKITELFILHGYEGIGLFYTILEKLALQEKPVKTVVLKKQLSVGKKLEKVWSFLEETGLISSNNGETFNIRMNSYLKTFDKKREDTKKRVSQYRENQEDTENVTRYNSVSNAPNSIESNSNINVSKEGIGGVADAPSIIDPDLSVFDDDGFSTQKKEKPPNPSSAPPLSPEPVREKPERPPKEHRFKDSPYYDRQAFIDALIGTEYNIYDLIYYHESLKNWADSGSSAKYRKSDWIATGRGFMLRDAHEGKAKLRKDLQPINGNHTTANVNRTNNNRPGRESDAEFANTIDSLADRKYRRNGHSG